MKLMVFALLMATMTAHARQGVFNRIECANGFKLDSQGELKIKSDGNRQLAGHLPSRYWVDGLYYSIGGLYWHAQMGAYYGTTDPKYPDYRSVAIYRYQNGENAVSLVVGRPGVTSQVKEFKFSDCKFADR